jgi:hypothetical protein
MNLDDATIRDLIGFTDEHGVLSFYAGHTPAQAADRQPTAPIEIRNQLKALRARLSEAEPDLARAVESRLSQLNGALDDLVDARAPGRGRALFVAVHSGETAEVHLQIPFRERVVHRDAAYVRPLVAALDEGREAGILVVSRGGARLLRWATGEAAELERWQFEIPEHVLDGEKSAPPGGLDNTRGYSDRDSFEDRIDENRHRFLRDVVTATTTLAEQQGWDRLVISAPPKVREVVADLVAPASIRLLTADRAFEDAPAHEVADGVWHLLRSVHQQRESELTLMARERALSGGAGALGLRHVCAAVNEGRVAHLLYDDRLELEGFVSSEGTLHPRVEGVVAASEVALEREPWFVERLVEASIRTSAQVTPLQEDAAEHLRDHEGIAALLRW